MSAPQGAAAASPAGVAVSGWPRAALFSLSDKAGATEFASRLAAHGTRIVASGGTASHLREAGLAVTAVEEWTGFGELLGGRVKTLHPHVHAPILARRGVAADEAELKARGLEFLDLVCVSLYPFARRAAGLDDAGMIEEIDIGGVALLRGAAKNHDGVIVVHDPAQYAEVMAALDAGAVTAEQRRRWAFHAFAHTCAYDAAIASELAKRLDGAAADAPPALQVVALERARTLRYGENPHQPAALYARTGEAARLAAWREGKELSYNNLLDLEAAVALAGGFARPACVIVKHNQPCGAACADTVYEAWQAALRCDELSAFGGVVAFNRPLDGSTATAMSRVFLEVVAAPGLAADAEIALQTRKNLRLVRMTSSDLASADPWRARPFGPWTLLQREPEAIAPEWRVVTKRAPNDEESHAMRFAWDVCAASRSNAIALARGETLIGLGSGQTSRVDAVDVALMKARRAGHVVRGGVLASDGFFPFPDGVAKAAEAGVTAIVQPGGSVKDAEVIAEADRRGMAMTFTDRRTFRH